MAKPLNYDTLPKSCREVIQNSQVIGVDTGTVLSYLKRGKAAEMAKRLKAADDALRVGDNTIWPLPDDMLINARMILEGDK